ncbi:type II secretion system F family protein [Dietzia sp.]|uniref:type II secretion system F family protein n=1 Tax=Dietzia sp. TaxID=1871616 RepID=UPI002FD925F0
MTSLVLVLLAAALAAWPKNCAAARLSRLGGRHRAAPVDNSTGAIEATRVGDLDIGRAVAVVGAVAAGAALLAGVGPGIVGGLGIVAAAILRVLRDERAHSARLSGDGEWVGALDSVVAGLAAGSSAAAVLESARSASGGGGAGSVDAVLSRAVALDSLGGDPTEVLGAADSVPANRLGQALALARDHGLPLVEVVRKAAEEASETTRHAAELEASLAGPRATALILTALPLLGVGMGHLMGADPLSTLGSGLIGSGLALAGAGFLAAGLLWTSRIVSGARK